MTTNTSVSDTPVTPVTPMHTQGDSMILDTPVKKGLDDDGFTTPKRTSCAHSARSLSPVLVSEPRYFDGQYLPEDDIKDICPEDDGRPPLISWADSTHNDGLGNIPPSWMNILKEIGDNLTLGQKEILLRREAKMKTVNTPSIKVTPLNNNATGNSHTSQPTRIAHSTPHISADAKGKERDFADGPSVYSDDDYVSDSEADAKVRTEYQIHADTLLAMGLQRAWDDYTSGQPEVEFAPTSPNVRLLKQFSPTPVAVPRLLHWYLLT
ncbi:hypothetical protein K438DRAFT_1984100 [Mycena galopus ATCC 62051]|nr:hypothetical protein K438DRAFT_1984100 [Mycena galopus ATCC 62051]